MARIRKGSFAFFHLSPVEIGEARCFAIRRGDIKFRAEPFYHLPEHRALEARLLALSILTLPVSDSRVSARIIEGRITPATECYSEEPTDPVFLRAQNIGEGTLDLSDAKRLLPAAFLKDKESILEDGDIVMTIDGALLGKAAVHRAGDDACCISNHMVRIHHGTEVSPDYLAHFLNSPVGQKQIKRGITGSAIPGIRTDAIGRILVPVPSSVEQQRLVNALDLASAQRRSKLAMAADLRTGLDAALLGYAGLDEPNLPKKVFAIKSRELVGMLNPERYRGMELEKHLPFKTTVGDVGEIVDVRCSPDREEPGELWDWVRIDDLPNQPWQVESIRTERGENINGTFFEVKENDILIARLGPTILNAKFVLCPKPVRRTVASSEFLVLRCSPIWQPTAVLWMLRTRLYRNIMYLRSRGGTPSRYRLDADDLLQIPFPALGQMEQSAITLEVEQCHEASRRMRAEAEIEWQAAKRWFVEQLLGADPQ